MGILEKFFTEVFHIRKGEMGRALLMQLYIFLVVSSLLIIKPVCNSLFLSQFGVEQLPNAYILVAIFAAVISAFYARLLRRIPLYQLIVRTHHISIAILTIFWGLIYSNYLIGAVLYMFYVWVAIFAVISTSQFWILANLIFNPREAKRLFGFIGAGAIAGGIFGGYLTSFLAPLIGSENLLLICIVLISGCIPIARTVWAANGKNRTQIKFERQKQIEKHLDKPIRLIINSRHLTFLAGLVGISVIVAKLVDYQFSAIASSQITDEDQLTAFFGFWLSNLNIVSLVIQIFLTRRVVGVFGVGTSLFFLPLSILCGAIAVFIHPALWSAVLIKMNDGTLKQSINRAGLELLALPIPAELKKQAKTFIDVFVDSFATGISGFLLVFMTYALNFSERHVSLMIILLIAAWIYMVRHIREEYIQSFRSKIEKDDEKSVSPAVDFQNESVFSGIIKVLESGDEKKILPVLDMLKDVQNDRLISCLKKLICHSSPSVRLEALKNVYFYKNGDFIHDAQSMVYDEDQSIRVEALHYLYQHTSGNQVEMFRQYLAHEDYRIRGAALLCAARESRMNRELRETFGVKDTVEQYIREIPILKEENHVNFIKSNCASVIGAANIPELYPYLHIFLNSSTTEVLRYSIAAAAQTAHKDFIPVLIVHLKNKKVQAIASRALSGFGIETIEILVSYLNDSAVDKDIRRNIPNVISEIGSQKSVDALMENMDNSELLIRHEIIKALNRIRRNHPHLKFDDKRITRRILEESRSYIQTLAALYKQSHNGSPNASQKSESESAKIYDLVKTRRLLISKLEEKLDNNLERIFRLLGLKYPPDDINNAYLGIRSNMPDLRANAVEFLDNLLESNLKRIVIPIIETALADALVDDLFKDFKIPIPSEFECFIDLLKGDDIDVKAPVLKLIGFTKDFRYTPFLGDFINSADKAIRDSARFALTELGILKKRPGKKKTD